MMLLLSTEVIAIGEVVSPSCENFFVGLLFKNVKLDMNSNFTGYIHLFITSFYALPIVFIRCILLTVGIFHIVQWETEVLRKIKKTHLCSYV